MAGRTGLRAAEVVDPNTGVTWYVEYRFPTGRALLNGIQMTTGVRVLRFTPISSEDTDGYRLVPAA